MKPTGSTTTASTTARGWLRRGFSLVEALAAVAIIGIIVFLALPNIVKVKTDSERNIAISRAEAFNMGIAAYVQSQGVAAAASDWSSLDAAARYGRIKPFLAFAPASLGDFINSPYSLDLGSYAISSSGTASLAKIRLYDSSSGSAVAVSY